MKWYDIIFVCIGIILIVLALLQGGKSEGSSGAITCCVMNIFVKTKERGSEKVITIITFIVAAIFMLLAVVISALQ